jgi:hypothetical protein
MILIWSRWGIAVAVLAALGVGAGLLLQSGLQAAGIVGNPAQSSALFVGIGFVIGGAFIWLFERYVLIRHLDKPRLYSQTVPLDQPQTLADGTVQTHIRRTVQVTPRSSFFFVPFKYWWIISVVLGAVVAVIGIVVLVTNA